MGKRSTKTPDEVKPLSSDYKSYSIVEIMAAGGTTAFANKLGKRPQFIGERFKELPDDAFLTDDEVTLALETLKESK